MRVERLTRQWVETAILVLTLGVALALRLYLIDLQSLWNDEGTSVALAARDLAAITRGAANDIHPPLYYYLLHYWIALLGSSELAVRSLSALLGTAVVGLTFALGRHRSQHGGAVHTPDWVALTATLIAALSPFQIYYSQETRMYILSTLLGAVSMLLFLRLLAAWREQSITHDAPESPVRSSEAALVAYALVTALLLYTHYFAVTLLLAENLAFVLWLWKQRGFNRDSAVRAARRWAIGQVLIAGSYVPWLFVARERLQSWPAISEPLRLTQWLPDLLRVFGLGLSAGSLPSLTWVGFAVLLLLGILALCLAPRERTAPNGSSATLCAATLLYLMLPIAFTYALSLRRPMYDPKFLLLVTPAFHLLVAQGVMYLGLAGRSAGRPATAHGEPLAERSSTSVSQVGGAAPALAAIAFVLLASCASLREYYFNPSFARDDYRGIARYIEALERQQDAVLINAPGQIETFTYYYQGNLPLYPLPRQRPLDKEQTEADLQEMIAGRRHIYAVLWATDESDPERFVEGWLDQHAYKAMDSWYGNVRLAVYAVPIEPSAERIDHPLDINLGNKVRLLGYNLPQEHVLPGDILQLTLFWQATAPMSERHKVFTHVLDAHGHLVGQRDAEPGGGAKITTLWQQGEQVIDNYGLPILPGTPPGKYQIEIGMYGLSDGVRLPIIEDGETVGDHIILQSVRIAPALAPPPLSVLGMDTQLNLAFGDVTLLGQSLAKLGFEHQPDAPLRAGDIAHLTLFWQADQPPGEDLMLQLNLQDQQGKTRLQHRTTVTSGQYPAPSWRAGEIIRDQHNLPLPYDLQPGRYRLTIAVAESQSGRPIGSPQTLAGLAISD